MYVSSFFILITLFNYYLGVVDNNIDYFISIINNEKQIINLLFLKLIIKDFNILVNDRYIVFIILYDKYLMI